MKWVVISLFVCCAFSSISQGLSNPFISKNGLIISDDCEIKLPTHISYKGLQSVQRSNIALLPNRTLNPFTFPNQNPQKINLVGLPECVFYIAKDIASGVFK